MTIRPLLVIGVGLAILVGGAACRPGAGQIAVAGAAGPGAAPSTSTSAPASAPAPSTDPGTSAPAAPGHTTPAAPKTTVCLDAHVKVATSTSQGAAGTLVQRFVMTNTGAAPCTVNGHPFLSLYGPAKQGGSTVEANLDITVAPIPSNFGDLGAHGGTLTLAPGGSAVFFLKWSQVPVDDKPCPRADGFDFRPPQDGTGNKLVTFGLQPCGTDVEVSEMLPMSVGG